MELQKTVIHERHEKHEKIQKPPLYKLQPNGRFAGFVQLSVLFRAFRAFRGQFFLGL
jgi:hypothetical protein